MTPSNEMERMLLALMLADIAALVEDGNIAAAKVKLERLIDALKKPESSAP